MKVGRIKDPLHKDDYLEISHLPSSHLLSSPILGIGSQQSGFPKLDTFRASVLFVGVLLVTRIGF